MAGTSRTRRASSTSGRIRLTAGPFKGVRDTKDPYDDPPDVLTDAINLYLPDPIGGSGVYGRPGFQLLNETSPLVSGSTPFRGQAVYSHTNLDGSTVNFIAMGGRLFRVDATLTTFTDVTPIGVTIDPTISTRVFFVSLIGTMVVTDGVNRPWIASNLSSTPITGTYIDYDGAGVSWSAYGKPTLYGGAIFFILNQVNGVSRRTDLAWCEPGQPSIGYQQPDFDDNWTLETASAGVLYAIQGTNAALYYWRGLSIGTASGTVGPNLASSATEDSVSFNVGAQASQTVQQFGNSFFFCDAIGRPWRFVPGEPPDAIWLQMRSKVDQATVGYPTTTSIVATSVIEPTLNVWLVGIWSPTPSTQEPVTQLFAFDAQRGIYLGRWIIGAGINIDTIGSFTDSAGRVTIIVLGSKDQAPAVGGYVWAFNSTAGVPQFLTTEADVLLTTEDGVDLTTEGQQAVWKDGAAVPLLQATTGRFGYEANTMLAVDMATVVTLTDGPTRVSVQTSSVASTVEGIPQPSASQDGTYRFVVGCDAVGRGPQVTITALSADEQFAFESVSITAVASQAGPEDA